MFASNKCTVSHTVTPVFIMYSLCIHYALYTLCDCVWNCHTCRWSFGILLYKLGTLGRYTLPPLLYPSLPSISISFSPPPIPSRYDTMCVTIKLCMHAVHCRGCTIPWRGTSIPLQRNGGRQATSKAAMFQQEAVSITTPTLL